MEQGPLKVAKGRTRPGFLGVFLLASAPLWLSWSRDEAWLGLPSHGPAREAAAAENGLGALGDRGRRDVLGAVAAGAWTALVPSEAGASGGSTAGKYSTIPSAKRRFYGRVRQGIYQFLLMEKPVLAGDFEDPLVTEFFAKTIVKEKGGETIPNCMFGNCKTIEKRTSRWNDFKLASDLLASAFRYDASDINRDLPQVKLIRAYHKKVEKFRTAVEEGNTDKAKQLYKNAKLDLSRYTRMVELAPITSEDYTHEWDTAPRIVCQDNFCLS